MDKNVLANNISDKICLFHFDVFECHEYFGFKLLPNKKIIFWKGKKLYLIFFDLDFEEIIKLHSEISTFDYIDNYTFL